MNSFKSIREKYNVTRLMKKLFNKHADESFDSGDEGKWDRVPTKIKMDELLSVDVIPKESVMDPDKSDKE